MLRYMTSEWDTPEWRLAVPEAMRVSRLIDFGAAAHAGGYAGKDKAKREMSFSLFLWLISKLLQTCGSVSYSTNLEPRTEKSTRCVASCHAHPTPARAIC